MATKTLRRKAEDTCLEDLRVLIGPNFKPCRDDVPEPGQVYKRMVGGQAVDRMRVQKRVFKGSPMIPKGLLVGYEIHMAGGVPVSSVCDVPPEQMEVCRRYAFGIDMPDWDEVEARHNRTMRAIAQKKQFGEVIDKPEVGNLDDRVARLVAAEIARLERESAKHAEPAKK